MVIVASYDWESDTWTHNGDNSARTAWREAVAEIAEKAKDKLPECHGRVESAVKMVLAGDVELLADGTTRVASQSNGSTAYHAINGHCPTGTGAQQGQAGPAQRGQQWCWPFTHRAPPGAAPTPG